jgi:hypothetical protein
VARITAPGAPGKLRPVTLYGNPITTAPVEDGVPAMAGPNLKQVAARSGTLAQ